MFPIFYPIFGFGMYLTLPIVIWIFYFLYRILYENSKSVIWFSILVSLLMQTHIITTVVVAFYCIVFLMLNIKKLNLLKIRDLILSLLLALALSAGYVFQYLEQTLSQKFLFSWTNRDFPIEF